MKASTAVVAASLAANAAMVGVFAFKPALAPKTVRNVIPRVSSAGPAAPGPTRAQKRTPTSPAGQNQSNFWSTLQSEDPATLVAHLRAAGFSPSLIRAIVSAQIDRLFSARMKALVGSTTDAPFWKPDPMNSPNTNKFFDDYNQVYRDRSKLLRQILGDDFFAGSGADPTEIQRRQYGDMSKTKIELVDRIVSDYSEMNSQIRASMQGITLPEDREKMTLLEREKHADLAAILTPQELAEYEMRTSSVTARLRMPLTLMDATETEFRAIFAIQQQFNDRVNPTISGAVSAEFMQQRTAAIAEMNGQIKTVLGDQRFADYARATSSEFQQLNRLAQRENIPNDVAVRTYNLRDAVAAESNRIAADASLNNDQKRAALQTLAQNTKAQIVSSLGANAGNGYVQAARWIATVERGGVIAFGADGQPTTTRMIAPSNPTAPAPRN